MSVELKGRNGYAVGSKNYFRKLNEAQTLSELMKVKDSCNYYNDLFRAINNSSGENSLTAKSYRSRVSSVLEALANTIERDLKKGIQNNDYILDENVDRLKHAGEELARCGVSKGKDIVKQSQALSWFVGGNRQKIVQLQKNLNKLGIKGKNGRLKEDGVYGKETLSAWMAFMKKLETGTVPTLAWVDALKNNSTTLEIGSGFKGINNAIQDAVLMDTPFKNKDVLQNHHYFRIDPPHPTSSGYRWGKFQGEMRPMNYNHINIDFGETPTSLQSWIQKNYNHYPLTDSAYNATKDLKAFGKTVRYAGRTLLIAGVALDTLELGLAIDKDLKDADKKLGKKTVSTAAKIGGRWAGAAAGAQVGAWAGAFTGPAAPVVIPVLALIGGIIGSFSGDAFAEWVVDITYAGE